MLYILNHVHWLKFLQEYPMTCCDSGKKIPDVHKSVELKNLKYEINIVPQQQRAVHTWG